MNSTRQNTNDVAKTKLLQARGSSGDSCSGHVPEAGSGLALLTGAVHAAGASSSRRGPPSQHLRARMARCATASTFFLTTESGRTARMLIRSVKDALPDERVTNW